MAGYSSTPLHRKLGIKPGHRVLLRGAPEGFESCLDPLADGVRILKSARSPVNVIVAFFDSEAAMLKSFPGLMKLMLPDAGLWIGWPKKSSGVPTDLSFDRVQTAGLNAGLVDNKICALDDTWSGLRLVIRKENRRRP